MRRSQRASTAGEGVERLIARALRADRHAGARRLAALHRRRRRRWPCSRSAATAAANCIPQSDIDLLVLAEPRVQTAARTRRCRASSRCCGTPAWPAGHAVRSAGAMRARRARRHHRADRADGSCGRWRRRCARESRWSRRCRRSRCGRRRTTSRPSARSSARATRASTTPPTTSNPTSRKARAACATCRPSRWMALRLYWRARPATRWCRWACWARTNAPRWSASGATCARLRFGLHLVAGRREERLRFDHQKPLAARLGLQDEDDNLAVEQMMQGFFRARALRAADQRPPAAALRGTARRRSAPVPSRSTGLRAAPWLPGDDRRRALAARHRRRVRAVRRPGPRTPTCAACIRRPRARWPSRLPASGLLPRTTPAGARALHRAAARAAARCEMLERMARLGVLGRWLPAFAQVVRAHAVRPVPCLHGRPAHAGGAAQHRRLR